MSPAGESSGGISPVKGPVGLQLWSLRDQFTRDVPGSLDLVKSWGFKYVELAGTYSFTAEEFRKQLDARGLVAPSGHFSYDRFRDDPGSVAHDAKTLGLQCAGCAWIPHGDPFDEKTCREAIAVFNRAGEVLSKQGLKFFYHVHGYEFQPFGKDTLFDLIMSETDPKFAGFEMDAFWIVHPGHDPVKLLEKYGTRWQLLHLKGMLDSTPTGFATGQTDVTNNVALGTGKIDYAPIIAAAKKIGVKWFVIEDESPEVLKQVPQSLCYLNRFDW